MTIGVENSLSLAKSKMARLRERVSTHYEDGPNKNEATDLLDLVDVLIRLAETQAKTISSLQMHVSQAMSEARRWR